VPLSEAGVDATQLNALFMRHHEARRVDDQHQARSVTVPTRAHEPVNLPALQKEQDALAELLQPLLNREAGQALFERGSMNRPLVAHDGRSETRMLDHNAL